MGDENGDGKGGFVVFDQDFNVKGTWGDQLTQCAHSDINILSYTIKTPFPS